MTLGTERNSPFKVLLFDLDDTLLDTWGQLVTPAAREACAAMIAAGLDGTLETCLRERERLFLEHPGRDVYGLLVAHFGVRAGAHAAVVREAGHDAYLNRDVSPGIRAFARVPTMLDQLRRDHALHLVTSGHPDTQRQKVRHLAIESFFRSVHFVNSRIGETKGEVFASLLAASGWPSSRFLSIGDRLDREIRDAKALGMVTCHIHRGEFRHLKPNGPLEQPDYRIEHIHELTDLLQRFQD